MSGNLRVGPVSKTGTGQIYKILCLTFALMTAILMTIVSTQDQTIESQKHLIRKMETNKSCMAGTGGNE